MNKKIIYISGGIIAIVVAGVLILKKTNETKQQPANQTNNQIQPPPASSLPIAEPVPSPSPAPSPQPSPTPTPTPQPSLTPSPSPTPTPSPQPPPPPVESYTITADDSAATPNSITVSSGTKVNLTFKVKSENVYYGGLDFRSSVINTGPILPGGQKTVSFTADQSFTVNAFWPSSGVQKATNVRIIVQ